MAASEEKQGYALLRPARAGLLLERGLIKLLREAPNPSNPRSEASYGLTAPGKMKAAAHREREQSRADHEPGGTSMTCISCETNLTFPGGYAGTDLCGPCCCGEAALLAERGETW
jgi:hypothetical protein